MQVGTLWLPIPTAEALHSGAGVHSACTPCTRHNLDIKQVLVADASLRLAVYKARKTKSGGGRQLVSSASPATHVQLQRCRSRAARAASTAHATASASRLPKVPSTHIGLPPRPPSSSKVSPRLDHQNPQRMQHQTLSGIQKPTGQRSRRSTTPTHQRIPSHPADRMESAGNSGPDGAALPDEGQEPHLPPPPASVPSSIPSSIPGRPGRPATSAQWSRPATPSGPSVGRPAANRGQRPNSAERAKEQAMRCIALARAWQEALLGGLLEREVQRQRQQAATLGEQWEAKWRPSLGEVAQVAGEVQQHKVLTQLERMTTAVQAGPGSPALGPDKRRELKSSIKGLTTHLQQRLCAMPLAGGVTIGQQHDELAQAGLVAKLQRLRLSIKQANQAAQEFVHVGSVGPHTFSTLCSDGNGRSWEDEPGRASDRMAGGYDDDTTELSSAAGIRSGLQRLALGSYPSTVCHRDQPAQGYTGLSEGGLGRAVVRRSLDSQLSNVTPTGWQGGAAAVLAAGPADLTGSTVGLPAIRTSATRAVDVGDSATQVQRLVMLQLVDQALHAHGQRFLKQRTVAVEQVTAVDAESISQCAPGGAQHAGQSLHEGERPPVPLGNGMAQEEVLQRVRRKLEAPGLCGGLASEEVAAVLGGVSQVDFVDAYLAVCKEQKSKAKQVQQELCGTFVRVYQKLHQVATYRWYTSNYL